MTPIQYTNRTIFRLNHLPRCRFFKQWINGNMCIYTSIYIYIITLFFFCFFFFFLFLCILCLCCLLFCQQKIVSNNDKNERASTLAGNEGDERKCTRIRVVIFVAETNDAKKTYTYDTMNEWMNEKKRENQRYTIEKISQFPVFYILFWNSFSNNATGKVKLNEYFTLFSYHKDNRKQSIYICHSSFEYEDLV